MKKSHLILLGIVISIFLFNSCRVYKQNILFKIDEANWIDSIQSNSVTNEDFYKIKINDKLVIEVFANNGELIIDPNFEFRKELGGTQQNQQSSGFQTSYEVNPDSTVKLPMIGNIKVVNYSIQQLDSILQIKFNTHYESTFVRSSVTNRRIIVLGSEGGKVIPLENNNTNLIEIIAIYGGVSKNGRAHNIRLIRGDLNNPEVQLIDLTTIEGLRKANVQVKSNDILYIEPIRKPLIESISDISPVLGLFSSLITLAFLLTRD